MALNRIVATTPRPKTTKYGKHFILKPFLFVITKFKMFIFFSEYGGYLELKYTQVNSNSSLLGCDDALTGKHCHFRGVCCLHPEVLVLQKESNQTLKLEAARCSKPLVTIYPSTQHNMSEDLYLHQQSCENLKSCKITLLTHFSVTPIFQYSNNNSAVQRR
jgi:hypothetical protein